MVEIRVFLTQAYFEAVTKHGALTSYFSYEFGLGFALLIPLVALPFWSRGRRLAPDRKTSG